MLKTLLIAGILAGLTLHAQTPSFEVASIKPAAPMAEGRMMVGIQGGPETPKPGQMTFTNVSLADLLKTAYEVKEYQISGPDSLRTVRFDISAKVPAGTTKAESRLMLQSLLAERFKFVLHHSTKESNIYALLVAKGGPKLKETPKDTPGADPNVPPAAPDMKNVRMGKDGMPEIPAGGPKGRMMIMMVPGGRMKMNVSGTTIAKFTDALAMQLDRPVVDMTGLTAEYDIVLDFAPDMGAMQAKMAAMGAGPPPPGMVPDANDPNGAATIFSALQDQLGLRLEARKGPVDLLVIDSFEKTPTEN